MRGIREISGLCYWLDNRKAPILKQILENERIVSKNRQRLLNDLPADALPPSRPERYPDLRQPPQAG